MSTIADRGGVVPSPAPPSGAPTTSPPRPTIWRWLRPAAPTAAVIGGLLAIAVWGNITHWKFFRFSAVAEKGAGGVDDWCVTHNVPESQCIECKPDLYPKEKDFGWCSEHGIHNCPLHHPQVIQVNGQPHIPADAMAQAARAFSIVERPENNSRCMLYQKRIQVASVEAMKKAGVDVTLVETAPVTEAIAVSGELIFDQTKTGQLSSRVSGTVWRVEKQVGDRVARGELLALVDAGEVGQAKSRFLKALLSVELAKATADRLQRVSDAVAGRLILEAQNALKGSQAELQGAQQALVNLGFPVVIEHFQGLNELEAAQRLQFVGLPQELVATLDPATTTTNLLPLKAPFDGVIVERSVVTGQVVDAQKTLFVVSNPNTLWLQLNVPQEHAKYLDLGQRVTFRADGGKLEATGTISWIAAAIDESTRTLKARAEVANPDGRLRANVFGQGQIILREENKAVVVPSDAIHWDGSCNVVFVRDKRFFEKDSPKFFHIRSVRPGTRTANGTEIIAGLVPGEVIATKGSGGLLAQLLKSNLGKGCCEHD